MVLSLSAFLMFTFVSARTLVRTSRSFVLRTAERYTNVVKSNEFWLSVWKKCCLENRIADEIEKCEPAELNNLLERIYAEIKNIQGEEDEPKSLSARPYLSLNLSKDDSDTD